MRIIKKVILGIAVLASVVPILTTRVLANSVSLGFKHKASSENTVTVQIYLKPGGNLVNRVTADFSYPSNLLEVSSIQTEDSLFEDIVRQDYSTSGIVYISCYSPAGVRGEGEVASVILKPISDGQAELAFTDDAAVLSAATSEDILEEVSTASYTIGEDLSVLPQTGFVTGTQLMYALILLTLLVMIVLFAIIGFSIWGGVYFSLGKWKIEGRYEVGIGKKSNDKKKKKNPTAKAKASKQKKKK